MESLIEHLKTLEITVKWIKVSEEHCERHVIRKQGIWWRVFIGKHTNHHVYQSLFEINALRYKADLDRCFWDGYYIAQCQVSDLIKETRIEYETHTNTASVDTQGST